MLLWLLPIFRRGNDERISSSLFRRCSLPTAPFLIGLLVAGLLVVQTSGQQQQMDSVPSADIEYEIVLPISSSAPLVASPQTLDWQGEWVRRFSPRVVVQNGWKYRSLPRHDFISGGSASSDHRQRIVLHKKWSALEPSIRFV